MGRAHLKGKLQEALTGEPQGFLSASSSFNKTCKLIENYVSFLHTNTSGSKSLSPHHTTSHQRTNMEFLSNKFSRFSCDKGERPIQVATPVSPIGPNLLALPGPRS